MRRLALTALFLAAFALAALLGASRFSAGARAPANIEPRSGGVSSSSSETIPLTIGGSVFIAEVARTPSELSRGLGLRPSLATDRAMLFVFPASEYQGIWMKDMRFPIDILWLDDTGEVADAREEVAPETFPKIFVPSRKSRFVIELSSGTVKKTGVKVGEIVKFPKNILE